ncbi:MAG: host attachment protein [Patescibacteria group bacterium]|nr:host attachment protein [Patescibacteria group bacterium]
MLLPENLQNFSEPTLILIGNFGKTNIHLTDEIEINSIATIEAPNPTYEGGDSSVVVGDGRHSKTETGADDGENRKKYTKELTKTITDLVDDHGIKDIQLIMPAELIRRIEEELSNDISELITRKLDKDLTKTDFVEALERLHETMEPIKE